MFKCINSASDILRSRENEGVFKILISNHLTDDEIRFKQYFGLTKNECYSLLGVIQDVDAQKSQPHSRNITAI